MFLKITNSFLSGPVRQYSHAHPEGDRVHREVRPLCRPEMQNRTGVRLKVTVRSGFLKKNLPLTLFGHQFVPKSCIITRLPYRDTCS